MYFLALSADRTKCNDKFVAMSTASSQRTICEYHFPLKGTKMADSSSRSGKVQDDPGTSCCAKKVRKFSKIHGNK